MASNFLTGLTGGAAVNNVNVIITSTGRRHVRSTDRKAGAFAARALLSRRSVNEFSTTAPFTVKTS